MRTIAQNCDSTSVTKFLLKACDFLLHSKYVLHPDNSNVLHKVNQLWIGGRIATAAAPIYRFVDLDTSNRNYVDPSV